LFVVLIVRSATASFGLGVAVLSVGFLVSAGVFAGSSGAATVDASVDPPVEPSLASAVRGAG
jgi:hypothetical protein